MAAQLQRAAAPVAESRPAARRSVVARRRVVRRCGAGGCCGPCKQRRQDELERDSHRLSLQPKLALSVPGDPYEREADRVADAIAGPGGAPPSVGRAPEDGADLPDATARRIEALRGHGAPLGDDVRRYFEPRFGADLGSVRVHTGGEAHATATAVDAIAYTVGEDIAFARGQYAPSTTAGRRLLAHELVHVMQQRQTPMPAVRRWGYRWGEPERGAPTAKFRARSGSDIHSEVLPALGRESGLFTEAPVPNAIRSGAGFEVSRGGADLYGATTTVGIEWPRQQVPQSLPSKRGTQFRGEPYAHKRLSAPQIGTLPGTIVGVDAAPQDIALGDLKGGFDSVIAAEGPDQVENYKKGFDLAAREFNEYARRHPRRVRGGTTWNPTLRSLREGEVTVPPYYRPGAATDQPPKRLVLVGPSNRPLAEFSARLNARGKLYVFHAGRPGIWSYMYAPIQQLQLAQLPEAARTLPEQVTRLLVNPLLATPVVARAVRRVRRRAPRLVMRQPASPRDPLDWGKWLRDHRDLTAAAGTAGRDTAYQDAAMLVHVQEANERARNAGLPVPALPEARVAESRALARVELWTGRSGRILGEFRHIFGVTFARLAGIYIRVRDRIRAMLRGRPARGSFGGGFPGAALKAAFFVLKAIGRYVVGHTFTALTSSLRRGTENKLRELIGPERIEQAQQRVQEVQAIKEDLEQRGIDAIEELAGPQVLERYRQIFEVVEKVQDVVGNISRIVNLVRWGARVIACVSPPAVGCLWVLAQGVLEAAAARVAETCWFRRKLTPLVSGLKFVRELPTQIAGAIVDRIRRLLPGSLRDIFADVEVPAADIQPGSIDCDEADDGQDRLTEERRALDHFIETVGEDRYQAILEVMRRSGMRPDHHMDADEIRAAEKEVVRSGLTAQELLNYAAGLEPASNQRLVGLREFIAEMGGREPSTDPMAGDNVPIEASPSNDPAVRTGRRTFMVHVVSGFSTGSTVGQRVLVSLSMDVQGGRTATLNLVPVLVASRRRTDRGMRFQATLERDVTFDFTEFNLRGQVPFRAITLYRGGRVTYTLGPSRPATQAPAAAPIAPPR